eukprot:c21974_g1_i1 orf=81-1133(+)
MMMALAGVVGALISSSVLRLLLLAFTSLLLALRFGIGWHIETPPPQQQEESSVNSLTNLPLQLRGPLYAPYIPRFSQSLMRWVQNKHYDPRIMQELLGTVKRPLDEHYSAVGGVPSSSESNSKRYASCAVVGNSGILLQRRLGGFIDSHEMVIRLNNAKTGGFERFVGSKTTLAFVNSNILRACRRSPNCRCHPYGLQVPMVIYICQLLHFMDVTMCSQWFQAPLLVTDARFDRLCTRIVKYYSLRNFIQKTGGNPVDWSSAHEGSLFHYSSGMQAVMLALGVCEKVSILGFGKASNATHHYHTRQQKEMDLHDYDAEYLFYEDLLNNRSDSIPFLRDAGIMIPPVQIYR